MLNLATLFLWPVWELGEVLDEGDGAGEAPDDADSPQDFGPRHVPVLNGVEEGVEAVQGDPAVVQPRADDTHNANGCK